MIDPWFWRDFWYVWSITMLPGSILCVILVWIECYYIEKKYGGDR